MPKGNPRPRKGGSLASTSAELQRGWARQRCLTDHSAKPGPPEAGPLRARLASGSTTAAHPGRPNRLGALWGLCPELVRLLSSGWRTVTHLRQRHATAKSRGGHHTRTRSPRCNWMPKKHGQIMFRPTVRPRASKIASALCPAALLSTADPSNRQQCLVLRLLILNLTTQTPTCNLQLTLLCLPLCSFTHASVAFQSLLALGYFGRSSLCHDAVCQLLSLHCSERTTVVCQVPLTWALSLLRVPGNDPIPPGHHHPALLEGYISPLLQHGSSPRSSRGSSTPTRAQKSGR